MAERLQVRNPCQNEDDTTLNIETWKLGIRNHMASNLELLERNVFVLAAGEENDIPVLVTRR